METVIALITKTIIYEGRDYKIIRAWIKNNNVYVDIEPENQALAKKLKENIQQNGTLDLSKIIL